MKFTAKEIGALNLAIYMMNYIDGDLYKEKIFPDDFCTKYKKHYPLTYQSLIREVLIRINEEEEIDFKHICVGIPTNYSNQDVKYYLKLFHNALINCNEISSHSNR